MAEDAVEVQAVAATELDVKPISTEKTLAGLKPRRVEAEEGSQHTIYTYKTKDGKPVEVLFYSPNELPLVKKEVKGKSVLINGEDPRWRTNEEWEEFSLGTLKASANAESGQRNYEEQVKECIASGKGILMVESGPGGLLETAKQLGVELESPLQEALSELERKKLTEASLDVIDRVLAGNLIDDEGRFREEDNHEGEALFLDSLMGSEEAKKVLDKKGEMIEVADRKKDEAEKTEFAKQRKEDEEKGQEALELESLVVVHATRYLPIQGEEGLEMVTTFEASDGEIPRDTIHFSLNHHVASHMYGSWSDTPYAVISPLKEMIGVNGKPAVLNTIDTFWEVGPGKRLKLPENTIIIQPGDLPKGEIFSGVETNDIRYKAENIEPDDIKSLRQEMSERARMNLNHDIVEIIVDSFNDHPIGDQIELPKEQIEYLARITGIFEGRLDFFKDLEEQEIDGLVEDLLIEAGIELNDEQRERIAQKVEKRIVYTIKKLAVEKKIMNMGREVHSGGMWAWGDSWEITYETIALGAQQEIPVMAHNAHVSFWVLEEGIRGLGTLLDVKDIPQSRERLERFESTKQHTRREYLSEMSQDTRRMLYLTGLI